MEKFAIELSGRPLVERDIADFETRHRLTLPADYRTFLLNANGGMFNPQVHLQTETGPVCLFQLYALNDDFPYDLDRMVAATEDWEQGYEKGYLKIARDPGGSGFFLSTQGRDRGCVYFLDREESLRPQGGLVKVATSFKQMILSLKPSEQGE